MACESGGWVWLLDDSLAGGSKATQGAANNRMAFSMGSPRRYPPAMIATLRTFARAVAAPVYLKRTLLIAFVVGSWLNLFNHDDALLHGVVNAHLAAKLALNYLTLFAVSNVGLLAHRRH
jgi:hypothetical protein